MSSNAVVFGGSGFIGTHLIRRMASDAGAKIVSVDIKAPRERLANVEYIIGDVRDLSALQIDFKIQRIYNFAAVHTTPGHPAHEYYETNIAGALEITSFAERHGVTDIVFTSSISVYGPSNEMKSETSVPAPNSSYGYSKLLAERAHRQWLGRDTSRRLTIVRPAVVFGAGEKGNFARMAALLRKGIFIFPGRKDVIKSCIFVDDLLDAIAFAVERTDRYVLFNGSYPGRYTLDEIVQAMILSHFPAARTIRVPGGFVKTFSKALTPLNFLNLGIHPDRVSKLINSTDIYPQWLVDNGFPFPPSIGSTLRRWAQSTNNTFV